MAKKNRRDGHAGQGAQYWFRRILANAKSAHELVGSARAQASVTSFRSLISLVKQSPHTRRVAFNPEYPKQYGLIKVTTAMTPIDVHREFRWAGAYLTSHAGRLSRFIEYASQFERALLLDEKDNCRKALNSVEEEFGVSLWLIKNKLTFLQASVGLDAQKRYLSEIVREVGQHGVTPFIAYYASVRNEASVTPAGFANQFEQHMGDFRLPNDLDSYLRHHIAPKALLTQEEISHVIRYEHSGPVIDYYETLVRMAQEVVKAEFSDLYSTIIDTFRDLTDELRDRRVSILLAEMESGSAPRPVEIECSEPICLENFLRGDYEGAFNAAVESLERRPDQFDILEIAARSAAILSDEEVDIARPLAYNLIFKMRAVINKARTVNTDLSDLEKIALNHNSFAWAHGLMAFTKRESSPEPLGSDDRLEHFVAATSPYLNPLRVSAFPTEAARMNYSNLTELCVGSSLAVTYGRVLAGYEVPDEALQGLIQEEQALLRAEVAIRAGDFELAYSAAEALEAGASRYYKHKYIRLKSYCLLRLGRLDECARFVTSAYMAESNLHYILPIKELVESIDEETRESYAADISMPILYDMYSRYVTSKYEPQRRYAAEDFLAAHGLARPSDMREVIEALPLDKSIYYLRHVCVEPVMDNFTCFTYSWEVIQERLAVCRFLVDLDAQNADSYQGELRVLLRRLMIQKRMREVEQSKIYVDIDSVRKAAERSQRESFNRYIALRRYSDDALSALAEILKKFNTKPDQQLVLFAAPSQDVTRILVGIIQELRDQYVSSKYGLAGYLSVRVRHGTLTNHLRNPMEAHKLVSQKKDSVTNEYTRNEYWVQRLAIPEPELQEALEERLAKFSRDFDDLVNSIRTEWIQVKKDPAGVGLLDFTIDQELVNAVTNAVSKDATFDQFLDTVFHIFGEVLSRDLEIIRSRIEAEAKPKFSALLTALQTDVQSLFRHRYYLYANDLINAIRAARTEMQVALDRIATWFRLAKSTANDPFDIEDAVTIGIESLRSSSHGFDASVVVDSKEKMVMIEGRHLSNFVDIFFTAFENIVRHSHSDGAPRADVNITYEEGSVRFLIENEVGPGAVNLESRQKLATIKSAIEGERYDKSLATEGGTGLHKIWKIIAYDFRNQTPIMEFGFRGTERFYVEFVVYTKGIRA